MKISKKLILIVFLLSSSCLFSQTGFVGEINVNDDGDIYNLKFGVSKFATDSIDKDLGEKDWPGFGPPNGILPMFEVFNKSETLYSPVDIKFLDLDKSKHYIRYYVKIAGSPNSTKYKIYWDSLLMQNVGIDSIFFRNRETTKFVDVDMKKNSSVEIEFWRPKTFFIEVYYDNLKITNVESEYIENHTIKIQNNTLLNQSENELSKLIVYDVLGNIVMNYENIESNSTIDLNPLNSGLYFIKYSDKNSTKILKHLHY